MKKIFVFASLWMVALSSSFAQNIVTLSDEDLTGLVGTSCGQGVIPGKKLHIHRNATGTMATVVAEGQFEAVIQGGGQSCNPIAKEAINVWRNSQGVVVGQLAKRFEDVRLLIGENTDGTSGKRFDITPSGDYLVRSLGANSTVSPTARPYINTANIDIDAQRIFETGNGLLVVGSDKKSGQTVAVPIQVQGSQGSVGAPIPIPGMPAGVIVHDFSPRTNQLLLGGVDNSGSSSFAVVNLSTGAANVVPASKPGAKHAIFVEDRSLEARLGGGGVAAPGGSPAVQPQQTGKKRGIFGIFRK